MEKSIYENERVYICSPLNAPTQEEIRENMERASEYVKTVTDAWKCRAIAPHSFLPEYLDDNNPKEREIGMNFCFSVVKICKALVVCGNRLSLGMEQELILARKNQIPIYRLIETVTDGEKQTKIIYVEEERERDHS